MTNQYDHSGESFFQKCDCMHDYPTTNVHCFTPIVGGQYYRDNFLQNKWPWILLLISVLCGNVNELPCDPNTETNCAPCDESTEYNCTNSYCIPIASMFDGINDCGDNSDEGKVH